jgi:ribosomal-protein-alanine N-acetyltransferase
VLLSVIIGDGWFVSLGVDPVQRRQGLGRRLVAAALEKAEQAGITTVRLTVEPDHEVAVGLYDSMGFQPEVFDQNYFGGDGGRLVMVRPPRPVSHRSH